MYITDNKDFYPTPESLIRKMHDKINWNYVSTVLEPSAGKGDIVKYLNNGKLDIDCIEADSNIRAILMHTFSEENRKELREQFEEIASKYPDFDRWARKGNYTYYINGEKKSVPEPDRSRLAELDRLTDRTQPDNVHVIHDDFLTFTAYKTYNAIIMNPPFSSGDKHLLKALEIQKYGGQICCILNAETIRNPYSECRKNLLRQLKAYDAEIEYIPNAFMTADTERKTDVEIAIVYVNIPYSADDESIFERMSKAQNYTEPTEEEVTDLDVTDYLQSIVNRYNVEVQAGIELIHTYERMKPYILSDFKEERYAYPVMRLVSPHDNKPITVNQYVKDVRLKYWRALLTNPKFVGKLTNKVQAQYRQKIETFGDYDFSAFNIQNLVMQMNTQVKAGVEESVEAMFDKLTKHSMAEGSGNVYLYSGWKTNEAYKIGKKAIVPCYGLIDSIFGRIDLHKVNGYLSDIERVLNYFDGSMTEDVDLYDTLKAHVEAGQTKNIPCKYFTATLYKKGTIHLTFTNQELVDRYNITIGKRRRWLPPSYGDTVYSNMTAEEKAVVDSFQGEKEYNKVMENRQYYLGGIIQNTTQMLSLNA